MPKIELHKIPVDISTGYPPPHDRAVRGRSRQRLARYEGLTQFGVNICNLEPGAASSHRHWHEHEDELVYVLSGEVVLCEEDGETLLKAGDAAAWRAGAPNGHCLINRSASPAVFIEIGTRAPTERVHYSEIDMMAERNGTEGRFTTRRGEPLPSDNGLQKLT